MSTLAPSRTAPAYLAPYRQMLRAAGPCFDSLLWSSRQTQSARFAAITEMIDLSGRDILDAGCGHADFLAHLQASAVTYSRYTGIDALDEHLALARQVPHPRADFFGADFVSDAGAFSTRRPSPEVIIFSGSLNTLDQSAAARVLERAWHACSHALVFNFLCRHDRSPRRWASSIESGESGGVRRFDTMSMLEWSLSRTPLVSFRQDYLEGQDATIVMRVR